MKKLLLLLLGAMMLNSTLWAVAPNSFVKFKVNGDKTPAPTFNKFSYIVVLIWINQTSESLATSWLY